MNNQPEQSTQKQIQFNNNPFSLAFNAMSQAFKINQNPAIFIIIASIILWVGNRIFSEIPNVFDQLANSSSSDGTRMTFQAIGITLSLIYLAVSLFISTLWAGVSAVIGLKNARFESTTVMAAIRSTFSKFWTILGINIVLGILVLAWLIPSAIAAVIGAVLISSNVDVAAVILFVISGLLFIVGFVFAMRLYLSRSLSIYALFDENTGVFASMNRSKGLTRNRVMEAWGMSFPGSIIPVVGPLLTSCGLGAHYMQLKVYRDNNASLPKVHFLSWLPLFAFIAMVLFFGLLVLLIALWASSIN
jgi:hypothetical protein